MQCIGRAGAGYVLLARAMVEPREGGVGEHVGGVGAHHLEESLRVDTPVGVSSDEHRVGAHLGRLPEERCICASSFACMCTEEPPLEELGVARLS